MNRIAEVAVATPLRNRFELESRLRQLDYKPAELAGALKDTFAVSPAKAVSLGRAYAKNLDLKDQRELFQRAARFDEGERRTLIKAYRLEDQGRGVVHAISQLPRAQARIIMHDLVVKEDGSDDKAAMRDVLFWLRDVGEQIETARPPVDGPNDEAVIDIIEDIADAVVDAVNAVVDAIAQVGEAFVNALKDIVNWTADAIAHLRVPTRTSGGPAINQPTTLTDDVIDVLRVEIRNVKATLPPATATDALLMTDLGLDSLDVVEFVARVEEIYRVSVSDEDWQGLTTLRRIPDYVRTHR